MSKMKPLDKYCTLLFDEMSISLGLSYKECDDEIEGFEHLGWGDKRPIFSDHVIVFMLRGIYRKWKQPISYNLVHDLVRCIKETIRYVFKAGLKVIATVCDQGTTNLSAINYLKKETNNFFTRKNTENRSNGFLIDGVDIIPLFDPPHLMKGVRNNLLTKHLLFIEHKKKKMAKWDHVIQFYKLDGIEADDDRRMCPKLTDEHVIPEKIKKMKVKCCTQVFSQRISSVMRRLAQWSRQIPGIEKDFTTSTGDCNNPSTMPGVLCSLENNPQHKQAVTVSSHHLDPAAEDTADLLFFMDRLFDSVNGSSAVPIKGKNLRCAVTRNSDHEEFWEIAFKVLSSMKYKCSQTNRESVPPTLKHWISTLHGFRFLSI